MPKPVLTILLLFACLSGIQAGSDYDSIKSLTPSLKGKELLSAYYQLYDLSYYSGNTARERHDIEVLRQEAERQGDVDHLVSARMALLYYYYNNDMHDSLVQSVPVFRRFIADHKRWKSYYDAWVLLVNEYIFTSNNNTALREVRQMYKDAQQRKDDYGTGLASYGMGNAYMNMGYNDEALRAYERSLRLLVKTDDEIKTILDVYPYYCDVLAEKKYYDRMLAVSDEWRSYLENHRHQLNLETDNAYKSTYYTYYYNSRSVALMGLGRYDEAYELLQKAYENTKDVADVSQLSVLYNLSRLFLKQGNLPKAMEFNNKVMAFYKESADASGLLLAKKQRAEIVLQSRRFEEAASLYKEVYLLADSINMNDVKNQLNEFNTLFKVDELEMKQQQARTRNNYIILGIIIASLLVIGTIGFLTMRRLRRKNEELVIARDQAQESLQMKSAFIKNISHEIRTPLNILSGFTQLVTNPDLTLTKEEKLGMNREISENTKRITSLINTLLEMSESSTVTVIERNDVVTVSHLAAEAVTVSGVAESDGIDFELQDESAGRQLHTNLVYAARALAHLLENGRKFTKKGRVVLRCAVDGGFARFVVEDTGIGVKAEDASRIFDEFVQVDEYAEGVGVGLPVSRNIARRLGGDIVLDESYKTGARFVMTLPLDNENVK